MATEAATEASTDAAIEHAVHAALDAARAAKPNFKAILADWVNNHLANTPASENTAAWNHITGTAIPALIAALEAS